jgi:AraC-like DNA-binding protein
VKALKRAVRSYAAHHANGDGLALTPVQGLRMMCVASPRGTLHSIYRPLVCLVLQGAKHMTVGLDKRVISAGQSVIVTADMPVAGRIVEASPSAPYLAVAIELEMTILRDVALQLGGVRPPRVTQTPTFLTEDTDAEVLSCASRLMRLLDKSDAIPLLRPAILWELHYWLLSGQHGATLRALAAPEGNASRVSKAVAILRQEYRSPLSVELLAAAAAMSLTAFHKHFKNMTSLTPGQYQKRLRLIEARRLMLDEGFSATNAALEVGYESVSQFSREYSRLFQMPPKRHALRYRVPAGTAKEPAQENRRANAA